MSMTDGLIEEELRKIVAGAADNAVPRADDEIIAEATQRARGRAGLMTTAAPSPEELGRLEGVLAGIRGGEAEPVGGRSAVDEGVRAQLIP